MSVFDNAGDRVRKVAEDLEKLSKGNFNISEESRREFADFIKDKMEGRDSYSVSVSDSVSVTASREQSGEIRISLRYDFP